jgi:hypothetical protein
MQRGQGNSIVTIAMRSSQQEEKAKRIVLNLAIPNHL